jgi:hypothetical protein
VILEIGTEGGSLSIHHFPATRGTWKFILTVDESTMASLTDEFDQADLLKKYPPVDSFEEAIRLMDEFPWRKMYLVSVHPDYGEFI